MVPFYSMGSLERSRKPSNSRFCFASAGRRVELAILLEVPDLIIQARMLRRLTCSNCGKVISMGRHVRDANDPCPNCGGKLEARADDNLSALARPDGRVPRRKQFPWQTFTADEIYWRASLPVVKAEAVFKDVSELIAA